MLIKIMKSFVDGNESYYPDQILDITDEVKSNEYIFDGLAELYRPTQKMVRSIRSFYHPSCDQGVIEGEILDLNPMIADSLISSGLVEEYADAPSNYNKAVKRTSIKGRK